VQRLREPADFFGERPKSWFIRDNAEHLIRQLLEESRLGSGSIPPVLQ